MFNIDRQSEIEELGFAIKETLVMVEDTDAFLTTIYNDVMNIVISVINGDEEMSIWDRLDIELNSTSFDSNTKLSLFEYCLPLLGKIYIAINFFEFPPDAQYKFINNNKRNTIGRDKIVVDFDKTLANMLVKGDKNKENIECNESPTIEEINMALENDDGYKGVSS